MEDLAFHLVQSNTLDPYCNLAAESAMTDCDGNDCYFYLWVNRPTVVIGYNQNPFAECDLNALKADGVMLARRRTGGGAVYHDECNLNFSFAMPNALYDTARQSEVIFNALKKLGLNAERNGRNDFTLDGRKFSGNAYYNGKRRSLHHGTLMVNVDCSVMKRYLTPHKLKLEKKGVESVRSRVVNLCEVDDKITVNMLKTALYAAFCEEYGCDLAVRTPDFKESKTLAEKYSSYGYLYGKWENASPALVEKTEWGLVSLYFSETHSGGSVRISTDGLFPRAVALAEDFCSKLLFSGEFSTEAINKFCITNELTEGSQEYLFFCRLVRLVHDGKR